MTANRKAAGAATPATAQSNNHLRIDYMTSLPSRQDHSCATCGTFLFRGEYRHCGQCAMWRAVRLHIAAAARCLEVIS